LLIAHLSLVFLAWLVVALIWVVEQYWSRFNG
jgi:hypothetical protein